MRSRRSRHPSSGGSRRHRSGDNQTLSSPDRPHRALDRATPASVYAALPKATPGDEPAAGHYRLRYDRVDAWGKISMRRAGRMHHLGIGYAHRGARVLAIADDTTITVIKLKTSEILSAHNIDADKTDWRNTQTAPGRWPGAP